MHVLSDLKSEMKGFLSFSLSRSLSHKDILEFVVLCWVYFFIFCEYLCCAQSVLEIFSPACSSLMITHVILCS